MEKRMRDCCRMAKTEVLPSTSELHYPECICAPEYRPRYMNINDFMIYPLCTQQKLIMFY